ncbi:MAG: glycosyltransferase family 1 protein [Bacteroidota bacterium]
MKVGFDAKRLFHNFTGLGNYSRSLLSNLSQYANKEWELHLYSPKLPSHVRVQEFLTEPYHQHNGKGMLWRSRGICKDLQRDGIDIYHGLSHEIPIGLGEKGIKSVVSMHDLIFLHHPHLYPFIDRKIYNWKFKYAAEHADKILAISESTKADLIHFYQTPEEKIEVLYQACDEQFYRLNSRAENQLILDKHQLPKDYLLYVGSIIERKNLLGLVQAIEMLPADLKIPLLIVGEGKSYKQKVQEYIAQKKLEKLFVFCEGVPFADFPALYQEAKALIYPSHFEGFGIPVIEALWSHTPVITSQTSSLPEAGGPNSLYIDPKKIEEISAAIGKVLTDEKLASQMIEKGADYVKRFHGKTLTKQLENIYNSL